MNAFPKPKLAILLSLLIASLLAMAPGGAAAEIRKSFGTPVPLGSPIQQIALFDSAYGTEDGHDIMYTTVNGNPAVFNVIDLDTNTLLRSFPLPGAASAWAHTVTPDGTVYIAASSKLFRYSPASKTVEDLGKPLDSESSLWSLTADEKGSVYGGSFPNGKVFKFDPVAKRSTDYGPMVNGQQYVRSIAYDKGIVYAGVGSTGHIVKLNPATGSKTELPLPTLEGVASMPFVYGLDVRGDLLFAFLNGNNISTLIVYDLQNNVWLSDTYPGYEGLHISPALDGKVYFVQNKKLMEFTLATRTARDTGIGYGSSLRRSGWVDFPNDPDLPGKTLVTVTYAGKATLFNVQKRISKSLPAVTEGQPTQIHALETGPDGKLYVSGYTSALAAQYDTVTQTATAFGMGQAESIGSFGGKVYFGVYPHAQIFEFDTSKPIQTDPNKPNPNPKLAFEIGEGQDRPYVNTSGGGKFYFGTIPDYGQLGGALVAFDPTVTNVTYSVYRNIVQDQDQSIVGLAYQDGKIYGSTTIYGGLGVSPKATAAKMFVWEAAKGEKIAEFAPSLPGVAKAPIMISGLTFGPDGLLWAAADGTIFAVDPETLNVVKSKEIYPGVTDYGMWRPIHIRWGNDGLMYTDLYGKLTVIDPFTLEFQPLGIETALFTLGPDGNIYYAQDTRLFKIGVTSADTNRDGRIDIADLIAVAKQAGTAVTDANRHCDVNGDRKIDIADLALVAKSIFNPTT